jgi:hypothetical protein
LSALKSTPTVTNPKKRPAPPEKSSSKSKNSTRWGR